MRVEGRGRGKKRVKTGGDELYTDRPPPDQHLHEGQDGAGEEGETPKRQAREGKERLD